MEGVCRSVPDMFEWKKAKVFTEFTLKPSRAVITGCLKSSQKTVTDTTDTSGRVVGAPFCRLVSTRLTPQKRARQRDDDDECRDGHDGRAPHRVGEKRPSLYSFPGISISTRRHLIPLVSAHVSPAQCVRRVAVARRACRLDSLHEPFHTRTETQA